jgi:hypothetical protein
MNNTSEGGKAQFCGGIMRNDTCPSPLDESETIMYLGSGEKVKISELHT